MAETLRDLGVVVDHPAPNVYEVASGDVEWLFVPLEAAAKMRASFILLGPLLARFGRVIISNPGGDRIGRRPVNLHVDAMRALGADDRVPQRLLLRDGARPAARRARSASRSCRSWAPRTRCSPRPSPRATRPSGPAAQEPEVDDLIAFLQKMGAEVERTAPDTIEVEGRKRLRGAEHRVIPDRIEAGTFVVAARRHRRPGHARRARRATTSAAFLETLERRRRRRRLRRRTRSRSTARRSATAASAPSTSRPAPYPGLATDLQPPTAVLLTQASGDVAASTRRSSRTASSGWPSSAGWAPRSTSPTPTTPTITGRAAPRRRGRDRRPARRRLADPRRAGRRGHDHIHGAHHVHRGYENIEASSWTSAPGSSASQKGRQSPPHEDRHRPRHGQRPRLRQGQGHRHHRTRPSWRSRDDNRIVAVGEEAREMIGRTPGNIHGHPADEGRRHRRLRHHRGDAALLHRARRPRAGSGFSRPEVMISVPAGVTSVEKRAVRDAALKAGAKEAYLIEEPLAAAIGANVPDQRAVRQHDHRHRRRDQRDRGHRARRDRRLALAARRRQQVRRGDRDLHPQEVQPDDRRADGRGGQDRRSGRPCRSSASCTMEVRGRDLIAGLPRTIPITSVRGHGGDRGAAPAARRRGPLGPRADAAGAVSPTSSTRAWSCPAAARCCATSTSC